MPDTIQPGAIPSVSLVPPDPQVESIPQVSLEYIDPNMAPWNAQGNPDEEVEPQGGRGIFSDVLQGAVNGVGRAFTGAAELFDSLIKEPVDTKRYIPGVGLQTLVTSSPAHDPRLNPGFEPETIVGSLAQGVTQFATGWFALAPLRLGKVFSMIPGTARAAAYAPRVANLIRGTFKGEAAAFVAFSGNEDNIGSLLVNMADGDEESLLARLGSLTARQEDDSDIRNRLRNLLEGAFIGGGIEAAVLAFRGLRNIRDRRVLREILGRPATVPNEAIDAATEAGAKATTKEVADDAAELLQILNRNVAEAQLFHSPTIRNFLVEQFPNLDQLDRNALASLVERFAVLYRGAPNGEDGIKAWFKAESVETLTNRTGRPMAGVSQFLKNGEQIIKLSRTAADPETFVHEVTHLIRRSLSPADQALADIAVGLDMVGKQWSRAQEEKFVKQFLGYLKGADHGLPDGTVGVFGRLAVLLREVESVRRGMAALDPASVPKVSSRATKVTDPFRDLFDTLRKTVDGVDPVVPHGKAMEAPVDGLTGAQKPRSTPGGTQDTPSGVRPSDPQEIGGAGRAVTDSLRDVPPAPAKTVENLKSLGMTDDDLVGLIRAIDTGDNRLITRAWINNPRLDLTDGSTAWVVNTEIQNLMVSRGLVDQARGLPHSQVIEIAKRDVGLNNRDLDIALKLAEVGSAENLAVVVRMRDGARQMAENFAANLRELLGRPDLTDMPDEALKALLAPHIKEFSTLQGLLATISNIGTSAGRLLNIHKVVANLPDLRGLTPDQVKAKVDRFPRAADQLYEEIGLDPRKIVESMRKWLDGFSQQKTLEQLKELDAGWNRRLHSIAAFWSANLLSGPKTLILNLLDTVNNTLIHPVMDAMGGKVFAAISGAGRKMGFNWSEDAAKVALRDAKVSMVEFGEAIKGYISTLAGGNDLFNSVRRANEARLTGKSMFDTTVFDETNLRGIQGKSWILKYPYAVMSMTDELLKIGAFRSRAVAERTTDLMERGLSRDEALSQARKWADDGLNRLEQLARDKTLDKPTLDNLRDAIQNEMGEVVDRARVVTYTRKLEKGDRRIVIRLAGALNRFKQDWPVIGFVMPFIRTPAWIMQQLIETTPILGLFSGAGGRSELFQALRGADEAAVRRTSRLMGKQVMGATLMTTMWAAEQAGLLEITGAEPKDRDERLAWRDAGRQPWSVRIGGIWFGINAMGPLSAVLAPLAAWKDSLARGMSPLDAGQAALLSLKDITLDRAFFMGLAGLLDAIQDDTGNQATRWVTTAASGFIPWSSALRAVTNTIHMAQGVTPEARGEGLLGQMWGQIQSRSLGLVDTPVRMGLNGETIPGLWMNPLFPIPMTVDGTRDPVHRELLAMPGGFRMDAGGQFRNTRLTQAQLMEIQNTMVTMEIGGRTLYQTLEVLVNNPRYQGLPKMSEIFENPEIRTVHPRAVAIRRVIQRFRSASTIQTALNNPSILESVQRAKNLRRRARLGESTLSNEED